MLENVPSGIDGLDEMISGGFPQGRVVLVLGGPGCGKTIFAAQFLYKGIMERHENAVFVSLDESQSHFYEEMLKFGWDFKRAEDEGKFLFIDATRLSRLAIIKEKMLKEETSSLRGKQLQIDKLIEELQTKTRQIKAKRVALDTLAALMYRFMDHIERRTAGVDLIEALSDLGATSIVTTELSHLGLERSLIEEEFLVHGVIMMQTLFFGGTTTRALQVEKMRGSGINPNLVPYTIDKNGVEVFPTMSVVQGK
ncbi:MAG TPA: ATPase domain-containing protein [Candidatus Nanoarchaeia archaeon]|nr:ATPase domain-containing protein [Candidatus Nanoarchaeia archaeon]